MRCGCVRTFSDFIHKLLCDTQVPQVVIDGGRIISQQRVSVTQAVTSLRFHCTVSQILCQQQSFSI